MAEAGCFLSTLRNGDYLDLGCLARRRRPHSLGQRALQGTLAISGDVFVSHGRVEENYWHLVGRGEGCG